MSVDRPDIVQGSDGDDGVPNSAGSDSAGWDWQEGDEPVAGYLLWGLVHRGRRCEVWAAWCRDRLTPVMLKVLRPDRLGRHDRKALECEHRALAAMAHPNIPRVYAADLKGPLPHLAMELIEGRPLASVLADRGPLDDHDTALVGLQLAAILRYVHRRGWVHLDVKPANLALRGDRVFLVDFDLALPAGAPQVPGRPRGSPAHMAPEQIGCQPVGPAMDLFALGTVLFEVRSGRALFPSADTGTGAGTDTGSATGTGTDTGSGTATGAHGSGRWPQMAHPQPDVAAGLPGVGADLVGVIAQLVSPDPARRPDADRAIQLLDAALPAGTGRLWPEWVTTAVSRATSRRA